MCGIAGVAFRSCDRSAMIAALRGMRHRGPDGEALWGDGRVLLGHRRLRILDLRPVADQPLFNEDGSVAVVFNGEIYNHATLRAELSAAGHSFCTRTDTESLVHGYEAWGLQGLLDRLDGMFAFAVWDGRRGCLILARDRFGKKPLFYSRIGGGISFASTLTALRCLLPIAPGLHLCAIDDYLTWMAVPPPETAFAGLHALPPGHYMSLEESEPVRPRSYAYLDFAPRRAQSEGEVIERIDALLTAAVKKRLEADVPLGAFLSGGIDSGLVVAKMAASAARPIATVTVGFEGGGADERPLARLTAERYGTDHHEELVGPSSMEALPLILRHFGQPFADPSAIPTFAVSAAARRHLTVALNGDGGDEFFAGYARPVVAKAAERYAALAPAWLRRRLLTTQADSWIRSGPGPLRSLGHLLETGRSSPGSALAWRRAARDLRTALYRPEFLGRLDGHHPDMHLAPFLLGAGDWPTRTMAADVWLYLSPQLLTKMDVASMAVGLEARSPLLDWSLATYAASLPSKRKLPGYRPKHLLRELARRYLPPALITRRKTGFSPPVAAWLRGRLGTALSARCRDGTLPIWGLLNPTTVSDLWRRHHAGQDWSDTLWTVLCLDLWLEDQIGSRILIKEAVS